jgi:hypothetical protein
MLTKLPAYAVYSAEKAHEAAGVKRPTSAKTRAGKAGDAKAGLMQTVHEEDDYVLVEHADG